jgi:hypothetical protein
VDDVQERNERAIGDDFVEWWNSTNHTDFRFVGRPGEAPDLTYRDDVTSMHLEVAMAYYDKADAAFKWLNARGRTDAPGSWSGTNPTGSLINNINAVLADKCATAYGPDCVLVVNVAPGVTEAERLEARLVEIAVPERRPFVGIYLTGHFGMTTRSTGGFRCWRLDKTP